MWKYDPELFWPVCVETLSWNLLNRIGSISYAYSLTDQHPQQMGHLYYFALGLWVITNMHITAPSKGTTKFEGRKSILIRFEIIIEVLYIFGGYASFITILIVSNFVSTT